MLGCLPLELLNFILHPLDNQDLCCLATLCHTLHLVALNELFTRNKTFVDSSVYVAPQRYLPSSDSATPLPTSGICIELTTTRNLAVLKGLRLARPIIFAHQPIKALKCFLNEPLSQAMGELRSLTEFLCSSPNISDVEVVDIVMDPGSILLSALQSQYDFGRPANARGRPLAARCTSDTIEPTFVQILLKFLHCSLGGESKLSQCVSFSFSGGHIFDGPYPYNKIQVPWIRRGSTTASILQTAGTLASQGISSLLHWDSSTSASAPRMLDLDSCFILHYIFLLKSPATIQYCRSIRVLTLTSLKTASSWLHIAAHVTLPNLEELSFCYDNIPPGPLHGFLIRHRKIKTIYATGYTLEDTPAPRRMPPFFLPNLTSLVSPASLLPQIFGTNLSLTSLLSLKTVRMTIFLEEASPEYKFMLHNTRRIAERLGDPALTLELVFFIATVNTRWLDYRPVPSSPESLICKHVKYVELRNWADHGYLDSDEVRLPLLNWLQLFPIVEKVGLYGSSKADEEKTLRRRVLFERIRNRNPSIKTIRVDGVVM